MKVGVFGLGYVGTVTAACLAREGHQILGADINAEKVSTVNRGYSPVLEDGVDRLVRDAVRLERLVATTDQSEAVRQSEISLVCVGTPSRENGSLDLDPVQTVIEQIGSALKGQTEPHTIVVRSTVLPGTTREVIAPLLERTSGRRVGGDLKLCFVPEFLREGASVRDFFDPPKTVIGEWAEGHGDSVAKLFSGISAPVFRTTLEEAESVKYADNAFHAVKITFANEIGNFCQKHRIDSHRVMEIFCHDTKLNLSPAYLKPGFAFGGSCLPKDLRAVLYEGRRVDLPMRLFESVLRSNEEQVQRAIDFVRQSGARRVGVLGLAFKAGTDDLRESPLVELVEVLLGKGFELSVFDRHVSLGQLVGSNRRYIEREIPHLAQLMRESVSEVVEESDLIVIGNRDPIYEPIVREALSNRQVLDLVRLFEDVKELGENYHGICW
ncbi:MAG: nucleotide sugar dehydrogenase [Planctomycetota bacterium]